MKIILVQPNVGFKGHTWEAQGLGFIGAYLKKFVDVEMDFFSGFYDRDSEIIKACEDADIVGFSCTSPQTKHAINLSSAIKEVNSDVLTVFGGSHPSALPQETLENPFIDAVVVGEGEVAFLKIVSEYPNCKGIIKENYISNLDNIPFVSRALIKNERNIQRAYRDNGKRITSIFSSRGCPFNCVFCSSRIIWGKQTRFRSIDNILTEVEYLVNDWNIETIKFADDTFILDKKRTFDFCKKKRDRKLDVPFGCNARVNIMDRKIVKALKEAGCEELWFGVESGNPPILKDMRKGITIEQIKRSFKFAKEFGIKTRAYCLIGMPNDSYKTIKDTERLIDEIQPDYVGFTILAPYPGTVFYDDSLKDLDWSKVDEYSNDITKTKYLSNEELKNEQQRLVEKYLDHAVFRHKKR